MGSSGFGGSGFQGDFLLTDLNADGCPDLVYRYDEPFGDEYVGAAINNRGRSAIPEGRAALQTLRLAADRDGAEELVTVTRAGSASPRPGLRLRGPGVRSAAKTGPPVGTSPAEFRR